MPRLQTRYRGFAALARIVRLRLPVRYPWRPSHRRLGTPATHEVERRWPRRFDEALERALRSAR